MMNTYTDTSAKQLFAKYNSSKIEQVGRGSAKASWKPLYEDIDPKGIYFKVGDNSNSPPNITMHGQDGRATYTTKNANYLLLADGHSDSVGGYRYSKYGLLLLPIYIEERIVEIIRFIKQKRHTQVRTLIKSIFKKLDHHLRTECFYTKEFYNGGSTMTINIKFPHPRIPSNVCSITSNIGDSPMKEIRVGNNRVLEKTLELNGDNIDGYKCYVEDCLEQNAKPKEVWISRFNCDNGGFKARWMTDNLGNLRPIKAFEYSVDAENNVTVFPYLTDMIPFYEKAPISFLKFFEAGGLQSRSGKSKNLAERGAGGFPSTNYGNTLEFNCQSFSSFGDIECRDGNHINVLPVHTSIETVSKSRIEIMGSDGFFDVLTDEELLDITRIVSHESWSATTLLNALWNKMETIAFNDPMFTRGNTNKITWDDVSLWIQVTSIDTKNKF